jgi:hypothetical protein
MLVFKDFLPHSHLILFAPCVHNVVRKTEPNPDNSDRLECPVCRVSVCLLSCRYYKPASLLMCFILPTLVPWYCWGETFQHSLYVGAFLRNTVVLNITWLVNSVSHTCGYRPYDKNINPGENALISLLTLGKSGTHITNTSNSLLIRVFA